MIFSLIFVAQTTFIGVLVTMMLKIKYQELFLMFAYGWIVGFLLMSLFIFIITIVIPLNFITSLSIICGQSYFIYLLLQKKFNIPKAFKINFSFPQTEQNPYFYIMFIVLTFFILMHYISSYSQFPDSVPSIAATLVDEEISIINSIIYGCNRFRFRIFLKDPQLLGSSYTGPSFPMLMMAMSMSVDTDYAVASCMYSYLNILATAIILWNYMSLNTHAPFLGVIIFFFNGGLAAIRPIFFKYRFEDDYITNVGRDVPLPWFQTLFYFLSYSKDAMFSIPAALAAMYIVSYRKKENPIKYRFAGALALLCPNPAVSATIFLLSSSFADCCPKVLPFALLLPIKFWGVKVSHFPIWREQQMNGHFCSQITSTFENYGLLPYGLLFSLLTYTSNLFLLRDFSYFSVWLITFFIRVGNSVSNNVMAQQAVILPYFAAVLRVGTASDIFPPLFQTLLNSPHTTCRPASETGLNKVGSVKINSFDDVSDFSQLAAFIA